MATSGAPTRSIAASTTSVYAMDEATRDLPTTGLVSHVAARTATGLMMADLWESAELLEAYMSNPAFEAALVAGGFPEPRVEVHPVDRQT